MKKIALLVYDISKIGGAERVSSVIANELVNYYDVQIISMVHRFDDIPYQLDNRIKCTFISGSVNYRLRELVSHSRKKLRKILRSEKIDVMMSMGCYSGFVGAVDAFGLKTKVIFCDHSAIASQLDDKTITLARRISCKLSTHTVVLTLKSYNDYIKMFKVPKRKISQIYNWIDEHVYEYTKPYDNKTNKIITVNRIAEEKGMDLLLEVAKKLKSINNNWTWDIYGDGPDFEKIKRLIKEYGLEKKVFLKGQENEIYKKYSLYSLFVLTSYREGLPLVLLESKANNIPSISFDVETGPSEIIEDSVNGYLIKPFDVDDMVSKINELLNNQNKLLEFSKNCKKDIDKFSKDTILKEWKELINNYINK